MNQLGSEVKQPPGGSANTLSDVLKCAHLANTSSDQQGRETIDRLIPGVPLRILYHYVIQAILFLANIVHLTYDNAIIYK